MAELQLQGAIVGAGRVGRALHRIGPSLRLIKRGDVLADVLRDLPPCPIYVCTTNDAVEAVITQTPASRLQDLVFFQNGMLQPLLSRHGLESNTQALLYLSAHADGSCTDGRRTVACGRWAAGLCRLFAAGGLRCREVPGPEFPPLMVEKLLWSSVFWLLSDAFGGLPVGQVATQHRGEVEALVTELLPIAQRYLAGAAQQQPVPLLEQEGSPGGSGGSNSTAAGMQQQPGSGGRAANEGAVPSLAGGAGGMGAGSASLSQDIDMDLHGVTEALVDYSLSIPAAVPSKGMALAEFAWRNGWFWEQQRTPLHAEWLRRAGVVEA